MTTLPFCFSWIKKFLVQQLQKKIWINCIVQQGTDYLAVYSNYFLSCWTNDVEDFLKITWIISPSQIFDCCPRNFLIQEERIGNVVSTSHWIRPVNTAKWYLPVNKIAQLMFHLSKSSFRLSLCFSAWCEWTFCGWTKKPVQCCTIKLVPVWIAWCFQTCWIVTMFSPRIFGCECFIDALVQSPSSCCC